MEEASQGAALWYENAASASPTFTANPLTTGLPKAWWSFVWGLAGLAYSVVWMAESWNTGKPLLAAAKFNHLTQNLWALLFTLACCFAILRFWKERSAPLGLMLSILVAGLAMIGHKF